ncbi:glycosyltransferase family 2 protein [Shewanella eurypsychrophilus]|uniref:Glycosyltransferase family 2 protein n=1 Tax=Shewanella eurypsychrophilus TaxID=2593656 RepID=A0ABX6VAJ9_9GAMM|nr:MULTISPECIES: glycosyltransferase family 2 protein [Shewanella]QFU24506.1 glycosyltransferase [Shewanella sp. YLB-09]QPG59704.1 glycosyltransferase family 2 protein [Shewanella eurypsychrophilus]
MTQLGNDNDGKQQVCLSVVVPMFNESEVIEPLFIRLSKVLSQVSVTSEIVFVDDGSTDDTWQQVQQLPLSASEHQCIRLSRNFGKEAAMTAGLEQARGLCVILLDADLQDPPELIPQMLEAWREGADVVNMRRDVRHGESWFKRFTAAAFYRVINSMSETVVPENVGDFRLLSRQVVDSINSLPERNRFMKGILSWPGFSQTTIIFDRDPRFVGETKWNYRKLVGLAMDGITSFSIKPLRLATWAGLITAMSAFIYGFWVFIKATVWGDAVAGYPSMMVVQLGLAGIQLLALGLMGEYIGRIFMEVKQRPIYIIGNVVHQASGRDRAAKSNVSYLDKTR